MWVLLSAQAQLSAQQGEGGQQGFRVVRLWRWESPARGYVVDVDYGRGSLYLLAVENGVPVVYSVNASDGSVQWSMPLKLEEYTPLDVKVVGREVLASLASPSGAGVVVYKVTGEKAVLVANVTVDRGLYKVASALILSPTSIVLAGSRFTADNGLQYFVALASVAGVEWSRYTGGPGDEYFNLAAESPSGGVCLAGPPGLLACYNLEGEQYWNATLDLKPLSITVLPDGRVAVAGVSGGWGIIELYSRGTLQWRANLSTMLPLALAAQGDYVISAGVLAPKPFNLTVAILNASNGEVQVVGVSREGYQDLLATSLAAPRSDTIYVAGRLEGKPYAEALKVLPTSQPTKTPNNTQPSTLTNTLFYVNMAALAGAAAALTLTIIKLRKRRARRQEAHADQQYTESR
jgi:hypothetical protein